MKYTLQIGFITALLSALPAHAVDYKGVYDSVDKDKASDAVDTDNLKKSMKNGDIDYKKAADSIDKDKAKDAVDIDKAKKSLMK